MKYKIISLADRDGKRRLRVRALVVTKLFAVHKTPVVGNWAPSDRYTLTHIPSGMAVVQFGERDSLIKLARELTRRFRDQFERIKKPLPNNEDRKALAQALSEASVFVSKWTHARCEGRV